MTISNNSVKSTSIVNPAIGELPQPDPVLGGNLLNLFSLVGKTAIITGGARGIGYAVGEGYLQAGLEKLAILDYDKNEEGIEKLRKQFPNSQIVYHHCDVRIAQQVYDIIDSVNQEFGKIDIFCANAGIAWNSGALIDQPNDDEWLNVMNVDVNGVYYCAKKIGQIFKQQQSGSLIITASISAHIVNVPQLQAAYNSAKAAVLHLAKSLAIEWPWARVNSISPGYMSSELSNFIPEDVKQTWYALTPKGRQGTPRELCGAFLFLASDAANFVTGTDIKVDGGYCCV